MSLTWNLGGRESGREATFNNERANKWTHSIIPTQNMQILPLSATAGSVRISEELSSSILYCFMSRQDCFVISGDSTVIATTSSVFWPAFLPLYFIPMSGSQYVSSMNSSPTSGIDAKIFVSSDPE